MEPLPDWKVNGTLEEPPLIPETEFGESTGKYIEGKTILYDVQNDKHKTKTVDGTEV